MIKVNLTKTRITNVGVGEASAIGTPGGGGSGADRTDIFAKIFLVSFAVLSLLIYEHINIGNLEKELGVLRAESEKLNADLESKVQATVALKEFEDQAKEMEDKLNIMKKLSRLRLRTVKALDFLQSSLPDRVWFTSVRFADSHLTLTGYATTDEDLTTFTKALENSVLFTNVLLARAENSKFGSADYKTFEISCNSEVGE